MQVQVTQPPTPPDIEGYLYKMKRKTYPNHLSRAFSIPITDDIVCISFTSFTGIAITGSWNKRWFFVDRKRKEFGYAISKNTPTMKSNAILYPCVLWEASY